MLEKMHWVGGNCLYVWCCERDWEQYGKGLAIIKLNNSSQSNKHIWALCDGSLHYRWQGGLHIYHFSSLQYVCFYWPNKKQQNITKITRGKFNCSVLLTHLRLQINVNFSVWNFKTLSTNVIQTAFYRWHISCRRRMIIIKLNK